MKLCTEEWLRLVPDAFIRPVVHIGEKRLPSLAKLAVVDRVAVVLGGDVALVREPIQDRLQLFHGRKKTQEGNAAKDDKNICTWEQCHTPIFHLHNQETHNSQQKDYFDLQP